MARSFETNSPTVATLLEEASLVQEIRSIQSELFVLGADLATDPEAPAAGGTRRVSLDTSSASRLEALIDGWEEATRFFRQELERKP